MEGFPGIEEQDKTRWTNAFRSWPLLIFQTWAEQRAIGTLLSLRCAAALQVFALPTTLAEPWLPTFRRRSE